MCMSVAVAAGWWWLSCSMVHMESSEDSFEELILSFRVYLGSRS